MAESKKPTSKRVPQKSATEAKAEDVSGEVNPVVDAAETQSASEEQTPAFEPTAPVASESPIEQDACREATKPEEKAVSVAPSKMLFGKSVDEIVQKSGDFINNKGKMPLFIVANVLLLISGLFLLIGAFNFSYVDGGVQKNVFASVYQYFKSGDKIKHWMGGVAGSWAPAAYTVIGILLPIAVLVPLALVVKNIVFFILKRDKKVHSLDAVIAYAFMLGYLGIYSMCGANYTWAHIVAFSVSVVLLAFTVYVILIENRNGAFPFFSLANIALVALCVFLLTAFKVYNKPGHYPAYAAGLSGIGSVAFIALLLSIAPLLLLVIMQLKKLPGKITWLFEFLVPAVAAGLVLISFVLYLIGMPKGVGIGIGFVIAVVVTVLFAAADILFALLPQLHKYNVKINYRTPASEKPQPIVDAPMLEQTAENAAVSDEDQAPEAGSKVCHACGMANPDGISYCARCGVKLK